MSAPAGYRVGVVRSLWADWPPHALTVKDQARDWAYCPGCGSWWTATLYAPEGTPVVLARLDGGGPCAVCAAVHMRPALDGGAVLAVVGPVSG